MPGDHHTNPLVSIALCTYNGAEFLGEQLESILAQTYSPIEVVIIDDASSDGTVDIIRAFAKQDPRVSYQLNAENIGYNRNFEKAIGLCSGEFIAVSDQDDIWEPAKIEIMMKHWVNNALFIYSLSGDFYGTDFAGRKAAPRVHYSDIDDTHKLVFNSPVHGHATMFKKELFRKCIPFPPGIFYDWWMSMYAASTGIIGCVPQTLTWHRVHEKNSSRTLTSISDKKERNRQLREQSAFFIETFFDREDGREKEKQSLLEYASLLRQLDGRKFSWKMFRYVMRNRGLVFHYKKKPFAFFSHLKHAWRMGYKGLL